MIDGIIDLGLMILKLLALIAVVLVFGSAILSFIELLSTCVFPAIVGEVLGLVSMFLPFNALAVFESIAMSLAAILTFLIARKIFSLTTWSFQTL